MTQDVTQWHCIHRGVCKARLHTKGDLVICKKNVHTHESNSDIFETYRVKAGMKRKASETHEGTHSILSSSINQLSEAAAVSLPRNTDNSHHDNSHHDNSHRDNSYPTIRTNDNSYRDNSYRDNSYHNRIVVVITTQ